MRIFAWQKKTAYLIKLLYICLHACHLTIVVCSSVGNRGLSYFNNPFLIYFFRSQETKTFKRILRLMAHMDWVQTRVRFMTILHTTWSKASLKDITELFSLMAKQAVANLLPCRLNSATSSISCINDLTML